jgi:hypothetical protein
MPIVALVCAILAAFSAPAEAQAPARGMRLSPEQAKAAWATEAQHVAKKLALSEEAAEKLRKTYVATRTDFDSEMQKKREELREQSDDRRAAMRAYRETYEEARVAQGEKFSKALSDFLTEEKATKAAGHLTRFSSVLDYMVHILAGFELGEKRDKALDLVFAYSREQAKLWAEASGEEPDFAGMREKMMALKTKLDTNLGDILSNEQTIKWKEATTYRGRGFGGRRRDASNGGSSPPSSAE